MQDYKANSHKAKAEQKTEERKKIEPVVKGKVTKKKNNMRKFTDTFVNEDVANVKSYVVFDVLVPAIKKAISDIVTNGVDMMLYGETGRSDKKRSSNVSYVSYNRYSDRDSRDRFANNRSRSGYSFDDVILETRTEAEEVIRAMDGILDSYGVVSVADFYELVGVRAEYTDNKYGWNNLSRMQAIRVRDGYVIELPKALPID